MHLSTAKKILHAAWRVRLNKSVIDEPIFVLVGGTGVGKSSTVKSLAAELSQKGEANYFKMKFLAQVEVGDLIGMPDRDFERRKSVYMAPDWWPEDSDKGILFFDELADAKTDVRSAIMPLLLTGQLHELTLPQNILIVAGMNPFGGEYGGVPFTAQFKDRLAFLKVRPDPDGWQEYANANNLPLFMKNMMAEQPDLCQDTRPGEDGQEDWFLDEYYDGQPSFRAVTSAGQFYAALDEKEQAEIGQEVLTAIAGSTAAANIITYAARNAEEIVNVKDLFVDTTAPQLLAKVSGWAASGNMNRLSSFMRLVRAYMKTNTIDKKHYKIVATLAKILPEDSSMAFLRYIKDDLPIGQAILIGISGDPTVYSRLTALISGGVVSPAPAEEVDKGGI